jgi:excisionase family DNA binding protein
MPRKPAPEGALFVRLPAAAVEKLDRAAQALGMRKKDLVAGLVSRYVDPDSRRGLNALGALSIKGPGEPGEPGPAIGAYSFQPYEPPEVMNTEQAAQFLQIDEALVIRLAEAGKLPGRKLGDDAWRFSRAALVAWLATPEKR